MFRLKDRHNRDFCLGPTHEEVFTDIVRNEIKSYKQLPLNLYQIQTKYRDERRPRFGVMRSREFIMKDGYSFDKDQEGLDLAYEKMRKAYVNIFNRCGLDAKAVAADSGAIGGSGSAEFMVKSEVGEDDVVFVQLVIMQLTWKSSINTRTWRKRRINGSRKSETPAVKSIEDLAKFFECSPKKMQKL